MSALLAGQALAFGPSDVLHSVLDLSGLAAYALVGFLAFAEAAIFIGFVFPGETAVVLGGVLANQGKVSLPVMIVVVVLAAIVGDSVGYEVGRHYGDRVLRLKVLQKRSKAIDRASAYLRAKGGRAVFLGRFTAFLRAVMPGLAGNARMPYPRFLAFNAAGAIVWGTGFVLIGYAAGASYRRVEKIAGRASTGILIVVVLLLAANALRLRRKERKGEGLGPVG
ncbi:MAG: rane-associated protein [Frankiaceae bacterium]|nr:rane-associated protein [Frankiaceae bacterium]MDQ1648989.1 rane-associated protein [Frankiaceae bacterium]MDQ1672857.1 rane-associated protein [Frankiaceae bacterium]